jgi:hypothetical protein
MTALEELGDLSEVISSGNKSAVQQKKNNVKPFVKPDPNKALALVKENAATEAETQAVKTKEQLAEQQKSTVEITADSSNTVNAPVTAEPAPQKEKKTRTAKPGNGNGNGNGAAKTEKIPMMSEAQKSALYNLSRRRGISLEDIEVRSREQYGVPVEQLTSQNTGEFIRYLQSAS